MTSSPFDADDAPPVVPRLETADEYQARVKPMLDMGVLLEEIRELTAAVREGGRPGAARPAASAGDGNKSQPAMEADKGKAPPPTLKIVTAASLATEQLKPRHFLVPGLIPGRNVTGLSGNGGDGKSYLALQLLAAVTGGGAWLGMDVAHGGAIYLSAEDELAEVHRRLADICAAEGLNLRDLGKLEILPLAGEPAILVTEGGGGVLKPTPLWTAFAAKVEAARPALVVIDNAADVFGGNEISRSQVRQFVSMLRGLALRADCAILLLSHPSVAGMSNGTGLSGSTAWHNSVRSRLYLKRPETPKDGVADPDARILEASKANYGPLAAEIKMRWSEGRFVAEESAPLRRLDREAAEAKAEAVFLDLLQQLGTEGRNVSANPGHSFAPAIFASHPDARGVPKAALKAAMDRLFKHKRIRVETTGPPTRRVSRIAFVTEKEAAE